MFTCHRYHCDTTELGIQDFLKYRNKFNLPFFMGETGHEPDQWIYNFRKMLEKNNMGWTFWLYKKMGNTTSMLGIKDPKDWATILTFQSTDRQTFDAIRKNRPNPDLVKAAMSEFIENIKWKNCTIHEGYIRALGMKP
jgi:hypothetical protein